MNEGLRLDSGKKFLEELANIAMYDTKGLVKAFEAYGPSWKQRGGIGAFMMLARKWDRMENILKAGVVDGKEFQKFDIFEAIATDPRGEGIIDDVRDLRRYLLLVEAEMVARGFDAEHRDNQE